MLMVSLRLAGVPKIGLDDHFWSAATLQIQLLTAVKLRGFYIWSGPCYLCFGGNNHLKGPEHGHLKALKTRHICSSFNKRWCCKAHLLTFGIIKRRIRFV